MAFVFTCKTCPDNHPRGPYVRLRSKTGTGTTNLRGDVEQCLKKQGLLDESKQPEDTIPYSEAAHRALIALHCAKNARPFNMVQDEDYIQEVKMLRPGTKIPKPITVQHDLHEMYEKASLLVRNYFLVSF
ncbi:hypothetical protein CPB84DRAFT_1679392 [Gymnopilus junonius]|uniref:Uncharacterized protein n=1 Tax=Gymnopilus junonius TaxID=109634 RepID=A0A9P5TMR6_GYMJU|nr:hypothetical protein CPB84DRAFT_1679392 [Gymnopilus junonius]